MTPKTDRELIEEIYEKVTTLSIILLGVPATEDKGLCGEIKYLRRDVNRFKRNFWVLVGILVGSGVLVTSVTQVIK